LNDVLTWGGLAAIVIVLLAAVLPAWLDNPLASALWPELEVPSGLAVLERNIQSAQRGPPKVDPGISKLPALEFGISLEAELPETLARRVRLDPPLQSAPGPRYWRARIYNIYNGRGWTQDARVGPYGATDLPKDSIPGLVIQEVEDAQPN